MKSSHSPSEDAVAVYFHDHAKDFDNIYESEKSPIRRLRDNLTRGVVSRRLDFVESLATLHPPARVIDVGCGSGRMAIRLAEQGSVVVGLDFAPDMLELAKVLAERAGVTARCTFINADFLTWTPDGKFDMGVALGLMDYVADPTVVLRRLAELCDGRVAVSFPRRMHPLVPLRFARLRASGCPVYFYSRREVELLAKGCLGRFRIENFSRDYMLVGNID